MFISNSRGGGVKPSSKKVTYSGTVVDDLDMPLPGVNVAVKGLQGVGTTTNADGEFSIELSEDKHILVFTYIGMKAQEVRATEGKKLSVRLQPDAVALKETVVTGIFTRKKESFTGSATTVKKEDLQKMGNQNILQSLKSLDPAFHIVENNDFGSDPNRAPQIQMRGQQSMPDIKGTYKGNPNQPLFILDGFERILPPCMTWI